MDAVNIYDVEKAFTETLCQAGIPPADGERIILDGLKRRYKISGDKGKEASGEYCIYMDKSPAGYYKSYRASHGIPYQTWFYKNPNASRWTDAERKKYIEECEERKAQRDKQEAHTKAEAIRLARSKWENATPATPVHNYALRKGLRSVYGARILGNDLLIPFCDSEGNVATVQTIASDGTKRFQANAPKLGCFCVLSGVGCGFPKGEKSSQGERTGREGITKRVWICEGFATGCTVADATNDTVVAAADAGNLLPVAKSLKRLWPSCDFVLAADNDACKGRGNPGVAAAIKVWEETGIPFAAPDFPEGNSGTDWNDYAALYGLKKTRASLLEKLKHALNSEAYKTRSLYPEFIDQSQTNGRPKGTVENFEILLKFLQVRCEYDEIRKESIITIPNRDYCGDNSMNATLGYILSQCARYGFPKSDVDSFLIEVSARNVINPVRDWILEFPWDGVPRVQNICDSLVTEDDFDIIFKDVLIKKWLLSAVAAVFHPQFRSRGVLVLCGEQGLGKTTWFKTLAGRREWFAEGISLDPSDKDSVKNSISYWIAEMGELEATFKRADMAKLKAHITNDKDVLRLPWGRRMSEFARRTVYCGTVNQREILLDPTGNQRWWCLPLKKIEPLDRDEIQQMWAEVYATYTAGAQWWLSGDEERLLDASNWEFEAPEGIEDIILSKLDWSCDVPMRDWKTSAEVLEMCGIQNAAAQRGLCMKASSALRKITGQKSKRSNIGARVFWVPAKKLSGLYCDEGHSVTDNKK